MMPLSCTLFFEASFCVRGKVHNCCKEYVSKKMSLILHVWLNLFVKPATALSSTSPQSVPRQVRQHVNKVIAEVTSWSMTIAASGCAPCVGFYGEEFDKGSYRYGFAGQELAMGWKCFGWVFVVFDVMGSIVFET